MLGVGPDKQDDGRSEGALSARAPRKHLYMAAELVTATGRCPVRVRNLSATGAMIEGAGLLYVGTAARLVRAQLEVTASVRWADERRLGISFAEPINVDQWMTPPSKTNHQQRVDQAIVAVRSHSVAPTVTAPLPPERISLQGDLTLAGLLVAQLSDVLVEEPGVIERHGDRLQMLDLLAQLLELLRRQSDGYPVAIDSLRASIRSALGIGGA